MYHWDRSHCVHSLSKSVLDQPARISQIQLGRKYVCQNSKLCTVWHFYCQKWKIRFHGKLFYRPGNCSFERWIFGQNFNGLWNPNGSRQTNMGTKEKQNQKWSQHQCSSWIPGRIFSSTDQIQWPFQWHKIWSWQSYSFLSQNSSQRQRTCLQKTIQNSRCAQTISWRKHHRMVKTWSNPKISVALQQPSVLCS